MQQIQWRPGDGNSLVNAAEPRGRDVGIESLKFGVGATGWINKIEGKKNGWMKKKIAKKNGLERKFDLLQN